MMIPLALNKTKNYLQRTALNIEYAEHYVHHMQSFRSFILTLTKPSHQQSFVGAVIVVVAAELRGRN